MERSVGGGPFVAESSGPIGGEHGRTVQAMVRGQDLGFPRQVAAFDCLAQHERLDRAARLGQVLQSLGRHRNDPEAGLRLGLDQSLALQPSQRLPDNTHAGRVAGGQIGERQP